MQRIIHETSSEDETAQLGHLLAELLPDYGIADVRHALREAEHLDISPHALAVDRVACDYLPAMFGPRGWHILPHPNRLPEVLTAVYGRLTDR